MKKIILAISVIGIITLFGFNIAPKQYKVIVTYMTDGKSLESALNTYSNMGYSVITASSASNGSVIIIMSK